MQAMVASEPFLNRPMHFKDGAGVGSVKAQNREVAKWLPQRNSGSYQAIVDYLKFLLGKFNSGATYPAGAEALELDRLPHLSLETVRADLTVFANDPPPPSPSIEKIKLLPRQDSSWFTYRSLFLQDLTRYSIPRATLAWESSVGSAWNQIMLVFLVKHWRWALAQGVFSQYSLDLRYSSEAICRAVMERWIRGRVGQDEKYRNRKKKNQRRATLFRYHQDALEEFVEMNHRDLLVPALSLLPSAACCSDTEDDGPGKTRAIGMIWRSREFSEFVHLLDKLSFKQQKSLHGSRWAAGRLDMRRSRAIQISSQGKAPRNLPSNCYCPVWRDSFGESHKQLLTQKSPSPTLTLLISKIRESLV
ncbi:uncharacterized protein MELLADRAFT_92742 [Melampsora larici-populina 98AG31]|uniref:Uncharacterized protein n=1 Tax=Melampsora larici-populina (strain 98AG31 / pathotype 3-4-7) TaxID=747676 RepID=F4S2L0_MELLP|nr:uncharacterized protein MELLADRAFT_92742 [Melampsora larici-populina 98AG31]EGG01112.1 hypothetical protein MELLADRAFT_92742 [Melampsora larici-populina 98AG31]